MSQVVMPYWKYKERKERSKYDERYDFSQKVGFTESVRMVIMGIDADTDRCGFSMYDPVSHQVVRQDEVELSRAPEYFSDTASEVDMRNVLIRLEVPTVRTIFGVTEKMKEELRKSQKSQGEIEKACWMRIGNSFRCQEIANQLISVMNRRKLLYELIDSSERMNMDKPKYKKMEPKQWHQMLRLSFVSSKDKSIFLPTKIPAALLKSIYPVENTGSMELRDSLALSLREAVYCRIINKMK